MRQKWRPRCEMPAVALQPLKPQSVICASVSSERKSLDCGKPKRKEIRREEEEEAMLHEILLSLSAKTTACMLRISLALQRSPARHDTGIKRNLSFFLTQNEEDAAGAKTLRVSHCPAGVAALTTLTRPPPPSLTHTLCWCAGHSPFKLSFFLLSRGAIFTAESLLAFGQS